MSKNREEELIAIAQQYGLSNYLRQYLTPSGIGRSIGEGLFGTYKDKMNRLREADEAMREAVSGKGSKALEPVSITESLGPLKQAFKNNKYIDVAHWLGNINIQVKEAIAIGANVANLSQAEIDEYYSETEEPYLKEQYFDEEKTAGVSDFLGKIYKGVFGDPIEKAYYREIKLRKSAISAIIREAEYFVGKVLIIFKGLGKARAAGNISDWIKNYNELLKAHTKFEASFRKVYTTHIIPIMNIAKKRYEESLKTNKYQSKLDEKRPVETVSPEPQVKPETVKAETIKSEKKGRPPKSVFYVDATGKEVVREEIKRKLKLVFDEIEEEPEIDVVWEEGEPVATVQNGIITLNNVINATNNKPIQISVEKAANYINKPMALPEVKKSLMIVLLLKPISEDEQNEFKRLISDKAVDIEFVEGAGIKNKARNLIQQRMSEGRTIHSVIAYDPASKKAIELSGELKQELKEAPAPEVVKKKRGRPKKIVTPTTEERKLEKPPVEKLKEKIEPTVVAPEDKPELVEDEEKPVEKKDKLAIIAFKQTPDNLESIVEHLEKMLGFKVAVVSLGKEGKKQVQQFADEGYKVDKSNSGIFNDVDEFYERYPLIKLTIEEEEPRLVTAEDEKKNRVLVFYKGSTDDREMLLETVQAMHPNKIINVLPVAFRTRAKEEHTDDVLKIYVYKVAPEEGEEPLTEKQVEKYYKRTHEGRKKKRSVANRLERLNNLV